jgi:hypothetical protein
VAIWVAEVLVNLCQVFLGHAPVVVPLLLHILREMLCVTQSSLSSLLETVVEHHCLWEDPASRVRMRDKEV